MGDAVSREMPAEMERAEIASVVAGFAEAARIATGAGLGGVEIDVRLPPSSASSTPA